MSPRPQISVLGVGLKTALGTGTAENWQALESGQSGSRPIDRFDTTNMTTRFAATFSVGGLDTFCPQEQSGLAAISVLSEALGQAGIGRDEMAGPRVRLFMSTPHTEPYFGHRIRAVRNEEPAAKLASSLRRGVFSETLQGMLKREFGLSTIPINVSTACASSASAIQLASEQLRRWQIDVALVVAADVSVFPEAITRFSLLSALSTNNDSPSTASRPFTASRDGFVMGEGAAALVLCRSDDVSGRRIAEVAGCGDATDNFHRTRSHPSGDRIVASIEAALLDADMSRVDIDYINAHGTSTPENDKMETLGILRVWDGIVSPPTSSSKSMIGHTLSAAGAVEAVITVLALGEQTMPPTINHVDPDPNIPLDVVPNLARRSPLRAALSNSFGFGGQNVSLVFTR